MTIHAPASQFFDPSLAFARERAQTPSRVGLMNTYSTRNLGDAAIITAIGKMSGATDIRANISETSPIWIPGVAYQNDLTDCSRFVSVGGDIFNNARPIFLTKTFISNVSKLHVHAKNTIVFGQTMPEMMASWVHDMITFSHRASPDSFQRECIACYANQIRKNIDRRGRRIFGDDLLCVRAGSRF